MMVDNSSLAKHSNDVLNEFKRSFTEKLCKRDNIITIGATNLEIDSSKAAMSIGGKTLDTAMLDRFQSKILVPNPEKNQVIQSMAMHYANCDKVSSELKDVNNPKMIKLGEFLSKHNISFRKLESIYNEAANSTAGADKNLNFSDIVKAMRTMKEDLKLTNEEIDGIFVH